MKKINFLLLFAGLLVMNGTAVVAQSKIKDGTVSGTPNLPHAAALVEFESSNKGVLLPRVALTAINSALPLKAHVAGMLVYNTASAGTAPNSVSPGFYYNSGNGWLRFANTVAADSTNDSWQEDAANTEVKLAYQSNGSTARTAGTEFVIKDDGKTGIGTATPQKSLHVNGALQITNELNTGGTATTAGSAGTAGQVLTSNGAGVAPGWTSIPGSNTVMQTVTVASGATGPSVLTWAQGWPTAFRIKIFSRNICGSTFLNEFIATGSNVSSNWVLNYVGGMSRAGAPSSSAALNNTQLTITNPNAPCAADGGGANAFGYTLKVGPNTGAVTITNNGNATRDYRVIVEREIDNY